MRMAACLIAVVAGVSASADTRRVFLEDTAGDRIEIATLDMAADGLYTVEMSATAFSDHFLSMRPFRCLEGPVKHWCHVPYPYDIDRNVSRDLTDLEYDFLFVWKGATDYGINMWNGVYYRLERDGAALTGTLHEIDMDVLSAPPAPGEMRPLSARDLHQSDPDSHWLPRLVIE